MGVSRHFGRENYSRRLDIVQKSFSILSFFLSGFLNPMCANTAYTTDTSRWKCVDSFYEHVYWE